MIPHYELRKSKQFSNEYELWKPDKNGKQSMIRYITYDLDFDKIRQFKPDIEKFLEESPKNSSSYSTDWKELDVNKINGYDIDKCIPDTSTGRAGNWALLCLIESPCRKKIKYALYNKNNEQIAILTSQHKSLCTDGRKISSKDDNWNIYHTHMIANLMFWERLQTISKPLDEKSISPQDKHDRIYTLPERIEKIENKIEDKVYLGKKNQMRTLYERIILAEENILGSTKEGIIIDRIKNLEENVGIIH